MSAWPGHELRQIAGTDDLHIAPFREDGRTYGTPKWIWSVVVDGELYVRPYSGRDSAGTRRQCCRRRDVTVAGMTKEVTFEPTRSR
jgi:hypothetical protein